MASNKDEDKVVQPTDAAPSPDAPRTVVDPQDTTDTRDVRPEDIPVVDSPAYGGDHTTDSAGFVVEPAVGNNDNDNDNATESGRKDRPGLRKGES
jgi:hypothetical protein